MHYNSHNRACDWPMPTQKATQFEIYNTLLKSFEGTSIFFSIMIHVFNLSQSLFYKKRVQADFSSALET